MIQEWNQTITTAFTGFDWLNPRQTVPDWCRKIAEFRFIA